MPQHFGTDNGRGQKGDFSSLNFRAPKFFSVPKTLERPQKNVRPSAMKLSITDQTIKQKLCSQITFTNGFEIQIRGTKFS